MRITTAFANQAEACRSMGSPMYGDLLERCGEDVADGGPVAAVLEGHEDDPGPSALGLRLLGSVHRLVLERRAGDLALFYPSVGGTWDPEPGWEAFRAFLAAEPDLVATWLDRPPQTNEVGRAAALYGGLLRLPTALRLPVRLHEVGASGGLNLLADRFSYTGEDGVPHGDLASPVRLDRAWEGRALPPWSDLEVVQRAGSDVLPVDATTTTGRVKLTAYVWPDQEARLERLRGALHLAGTLRPPVRRADALTALGELDVEPGTVTVLWHSVMWQYLTASEQAAFTARVDELGAAASADAPFVHLTLEATRRRPGAAHEFLVVARTWPEGERRVLGGASGHGVPVVWE